MRYYLAVLFATLVLAIPWLAINYPNQTDFVASAVEHAGSQLAAVILARSPKTVADIQGAYDAPAPALQKKARILIVPGHEPDYGGAEYIDPTYGHIYERNMTVELGQDLQADLAGDSHIQTFITRDTQSWDPEFADYFKNDWNDIVAWEKASGQAFSEMVAAGSTTMPVATIDHVAAADDVALRLYGITKWANENDIDIEVHIHFNDNPGHAEDQPGKYSGFAIYVPAAQYQNSTTTRAVADSVFKRLAAFNPVSDLPQESVGVVDDPELIALGADDTADAASMLIEYSYIYEPQIADPAIRSEVIKDLAYQTYLGLEDFFNPGQAAGTTGSYGTIELPHQWTAPITVPNSISTGVFALQSALVFDGEYPPSGKSLNDCPRSGKFGPCTREALQAFQTKHQITGEDGIVGTSTIKVLNRLFSAQTAPQLI